MASFVLVCAGILEVLTPTPHRSPLTWDRLFSISNRVQKIQRATCKSDNLSIPLRGLSQGHLRVVGVWGAGSTVMGPVTRAEMELKIILRNAVVEEQVVPTYCEPAVNITSHWQEAATHSTGYKALSLLFSSRVFLSLSNSGLVSFLRHLCPHPWHSENVTHISSSPQRCAGTRALQASNYFHLPWK